LFGDLQDHALERHRVVPRHDPRFFVTENGLELRRGHRHKGRRGVRGRAAKRRVVGGQEAGDQIVVGGGEGADAGQAEFVHQAVLQRAIGPLAPATGLGRVAQDVFDAERLQGPADLGEACPIGRTVGGGGMDGPVGPIGIEGARHAVLRAHRPQGGHDGVGALPALDELGIEDLLRRIVHDYEQGVPRGRGERQPAVAAPIEVQQLPETGPRLPPSAVASPRSALRHEAGRLPRRLDQRVGKGHGMLAAGELMKVPDIEALVALPIEPQDALEFDQGHAPGRRGPAAAIEQTRHPELLKSRTPAPDRPWAQADDIGHLEPRLPAMEGMEQGLVDRHGTLHGSGGIGHRHLLGGDSLLPGLLERSCHLLSAAAT
jgi:hypothetical protein